MKNKCSAGFWMAGAVVLLVVLGLNYNDERLDQEAKIEAQISTAFTRVYGLDPLLTLNGTRAEIVEAHKIWEELRVVFMSGDDNLRKEHVAPDVGLAGAAARGRFERAEAKCNLGLLSPSCKKEY